MSEKTNDADRGGVERARLEASVADLRSALEYEREQYTELRAAMRAAGMVTQRLDGKLVMFPRGDDPRYLCALEECADVAEQYTNPVARLIARDIRALRTEAATAPTLPPKSSGSHD